MQSLAPVQQQIVHTVPVQRQVTVPVPVQKVVHHEPMIQQEVIQWDNDPVEWQEDPVFY
jgi:hypothetical protein